MAKKSALVILPSDLTAGQLKNFFRMIDDGSINGRRLENFMRDPGRFDDSALTLVRAASILGVGKVISAEQYARAWGLTLPNDVQGPVFPLVDPPLRYTEHDLRRAVDMNRNGADWRLICLRGLSLREQYSFIGDDTTHQPCFYKEWDWWRGASEDGWATLSVEPGYYLLNMNGRFPATSWHNQEGAITEMEGEFSRSPEQLVAEAVFTVFKLTGERLLSGWYHWGQSGGGRVYISYFDERGLRVAGYNPDCRGGISRVVLLWKFLQ